MNSRLLDKLEKNRSIHDSLKKEYNGRLLKGMGDGILTSFPTIGLYYLYYPSGTSIPLEIYHDDQHHFPLISYIVI